MSRLIRAATAAALITGLALALAGTAGADLSEGLKGPKRVKPGHRVVFTPKGSDFRPRHKVTVQMNPKRFDGGNCCGIVKTVRLNRQGRAAFRWPRKYFKGDRKVRWKKRSKARIYVCAPPSGIQTCQAKTVKIK